MEFGIKDALDILLVAVLLYYLYKLMKESGTLNIFYGVMAFILMWVIASEMLEMKLIGTIMNQFMSIGLPHIGHIVSRSDKTVSWRVGDS